MDKNLELALNTTILKSKDDGIFIEPVCDFFGISFRNQQRAISKDIICQSDSTKKYDELLFGDKRLRLCVGKKAFLRWIQMVNVQIVRIELQELFMQYQVAVFDYLFNGSEARNQQLEDLVNFTININRALDLQRQLKAYMSEQNGFKNLCINTNPIEWAEVRLSLIEPIHYPIDEIEKMVAIAESSALTTDELTHKRKQLMWKLHKNRTTLVYSCRRVLEKENPLPAGYRRETIKLKIKEYEKQLADLDTKLLQLTM